MDRLEAYGARLHQVLTEIGVPPSHATLRVQPVVPEATELVSIGLDVFGREQQLVPEIADQWHAVRQAAADAGIDLQVVSAFRSVDDQRRIVERKLARGLSIDEILTVNAPPGRSEHHSGRALDLTTPGVEPLTEAFEGTAAFAWLTEHADACGLRMTYPRDNPFGVIFEPWHWYFLVRSEWS